MHMHPANPAHGPYYLMHLWLHASYMISAELIRTRVDVDSVRCMAYADAGSASVSKTYVT